MISAETWCISLFKVDRLGNHLNYLSIHFLYRVNATIWFNCFLLLPKWLVTVSRQEGQDHSVCYVCDTLCGFLNWSKLLKVIFSIHFCPYVFIILFFKITSEASQWKYRYTPYIGAQIHLSMMQIIASHAFSF